MKKWITLNLCLLLSGFLAGQSENKETQPVKGYEINGFITGKYTGKVYLVKEDGMHGPQTKVDSCEVKEGRFRFKGDTVPEYSVIYFIQSHDGQLAPVFLEAGQMNMTMRADYFLGSVTKGTINNNLWSLHQLQTGSSACCWLPTPTTCATDAEVLQWRTACSNTAPGNRTPRN